jgi:hypothetical protein
MRRIHKKDVVLAVFVTLAMVAVPAHASMVLTAEGTAQGFTLTTFADSFPTTSTCCGPLGIAFPTSGGVLVSDYPGDTRLFTTDTDNQHATNFAVAQNFATSNGDGLTSLGGKIYMAEQGAGKVVRLNNDGTFNSDIASISGATAILGDPANGLLYVSAPSAGGVFSVNPATHAVNFLIAGAPDGLSLDEAHQILYVELGGQIIGYSIPSASIVFSSNAIAGGADGTALGSGSMGGNIFVNTNGGTLVEINLSTKAQTVIASGGSRGDFVTPDPNGTLLLTQTDSILRLSAPSGGGFGSGGSVPEPGTIGMMLSGLIGIACAVGRRSKA